MEGSNADTKDPKAPAESEPSEPYDPYQHRDGHVGTWYAFLHLVKCSIGSGVLSMPQGFKNAGMFGGVVIGLVVSVFVIMSFLIMINTMVKIAMEEKIPNVTLKEAAKYSMEHSHKCLARLSKALGIMIDVMLCINYVGTCASYYSYVVGTTLMILGEDYRQYAEGPPNLYRATVTAAWILPFFAVNCIRNMKALGPTSLIGNGLILASLITVIIGFFLPNEKGNTDFSDDWTYVGGWSTTPLFIGLMMFSIGSIGVGIAVERDMKNPKKFIGWFGVYNIAMSSTVGWYLVLAGLGYWKYGEATKATIVWNLPKGWIAIACQSAVGLALFFSFPLMCFVLFELTWFELIALKIQKRVLLWEYVYRFFVTLFIALIALCVPRLDIALGIVGCLSLGFLTVVMPGILEYNYVYGKYGWKGKPGVLSKDVVILVFGCLFWIIGTYSSIFEVIVASLDQSPDPDGPRMNFSAFGILQ